MVMGIVGGEDAVDEAATVRDEGGEGVGRDGGLDKVMGCGEGAGSREGCGDGFATKVDGVRGMRGDLEGDGHG